MAWSAECLHGMCSACTYEDCECRHHQVDAESDSFNERESSESVCWLHGERCCNQECY